MNLMAPRGGGEGLRVNAELVDLLAATPGLRERSKATVRQLVEAAMHIEPQVIAGLGVPEDAEGEAPRGILEPLERAVCRVRRLAQAFAEPPEPLVVVRLHRRVVAEQRFQPRARDELHVVVAPILAGAGERLFDNVAEALGNYEVANTVTSPRATHIEIVRR